jgi:exopolyphosphatase/guanosine-5'-triphosphate,3'-diphosphate pyrophosphatase
MGSVRLLEELTVAGEEPGRFRRRLEEYTAILRDSRILHAKVAGFIATGGNIESIARLAGAAPDYAGVSTLTLHNLRSVIERLARLPTQERVSQLGLREDRADVILPAATVYERVAELAMVDTIVVPNVGVKDGIILDLVEQYAFGGRRRDMQERSVVACALALGRRLHFDEEHGRQVARIAVSLFDQLRSVHRLEREDRKLLIAAALLHDVGMFVGAKRHHKHSLYLIGESELSGLTQNEIDMVANIARYHRKSPPSSHHLAFKKLKEKDQDRVTRLSAILRVADALDREHLQRVLSVQTKVEDGTLELIVNGRGDLLLERWSLEKKSQLFEKVFGCAVQMSVVR